MVFKLINREGDNGYHIRIYDDIDPHFGFSVKTLTSDLDQLSPTNPLTIHFNSAGGSIFEGLAIYNTLRTWKGEVITINEGIAASMASVVFLAGKKRKMFDNAQFMVHDPLLSLGQMNLQELEKAKDILTNAGTIIRGIYESNLRASKDTINQWLKAETWLTAEQAKEAGFVHEIIVPPTATARVDITKLVARLITKGSLDMNYAEWLAAQCTALGLDPTKLTNDQQIHLKGIYDRVSKLPPPLPPVPVPPGQNLPPTPPTLPDIEADLVARRRSAALEIERQTKIQSVIAKFTGEIFKVNTEAAKAEGLPDIKNVAEIHTKALTDGWTTDKLELVLHRVTLVDVGAAAIHQGRRPNLQTPQAITCALIRCGGKVPTKQKNPTTGQETGWETMFSKEVLDLQDHVSLRDVTLLQVFDMIHVAAFGHRYEGNLKTQGFLVAAREAIWKLRATGNTTWTGLNIFDDAMHKTLMSAYQLVEATWPQWVHQRNVSDFRLANMYRLTHTGTYQQVGADGELAHGGFTDQKFQHSADTYGKIVGITRRELINDDLGALSGVMAALGTEAGLFKEELFWVHLLSRLTTIFPTNDANKNYISGASTVIGVDGLTQAEQKIGDQVNADNSPILQKATFVMVGTNNSVLADELYNKTNLLVTQSGANLKQRPDENPHVRKFRPIVSPFMNNTNVKRRITAAGTAIPGQSATHWILAGAPSEAYGGFVIGSFLNGRKTPIIEQGDPDFNVLGLQWRAYDDVGADDGDPKLAVYSKGAA